MQKKLTPYENGLALLIDEPLLVMLGIDAETPVEISTDGQALILTPVREEQSAFHKALENTNRRYGNTLKKLAE